MKDIYELSDAAKVAIHFKVDQLRGIRANASVVLARFAAEYRAGSTADVAHARRIARRFDLQDFYYALCHMGHHPELHGMKHHEVNAVLATMRV